MKPFLDIAVPYFKESKGHRDLLLQVLPLTLAKSGISVLFSLIGRDCDNALNARDEAAVHSQTLEFLSAIVIAVPVSVYFRFVREKLSLTWREGLTERVIDQYYSNKRFYMIETLKDIDNPGTTFSSIVSHCYNAHILYCTHHHVIPPDCYDSFRSTNSR